MAEYLQPNQIFNIEDQCEIFSIRCKMNPLPSNRGKKVFCEAGCRQLLNNEHIMTCNIFNTDNLIDYNDILNGSITEMNLFLQRWRTNLAKRQTYLPQDPVQ